MSLHVRLLAVLFLLAGLSLKAESEIVDAIVGTVDTEVILRSDVLAEIRPSMEGLGASELESLFDEGLEQAIEQKILYREGVLNDIKITDEQVEARLKGYRDQFDSEEVFLAALADAGETMSDLRERVRKQTIAYVMGNSKRNLLEKDVAISEAEIAQYYQDHQDEFQKPERVKLYRIFIKTDGSEESKGRTQARLEALREELALGADFSKLAIQHSEGPFAAEGGFAGWIERNDLQPELEEVTFGLSAGDVSPIIETDSGMMIFKVAEKIEAGLADFDEARAEIAPILRSASGNERYSRWMAELRKRSRVRKY